MKLTTSVVFRYGINQVECRILNFKHYFSHWKFEKRTLISWIFSCQWKIQTSIFLTWPDVREIKTRDLVPRVLPHHVENLSTIFFLKLQKKKHPYIWFDSYQSCSLLLGLSYGWQQTPSLRLQGQEGQHHKYNEEGHKVRRLQRLLLHNNRHTMQFRNEAGKQTFPNAMQKLFINHAGRF